MKNIIIIGAISFGKEVVALLEDNNREKEEWNILGFVDDYLEVGSEFFGYPILGNVDWLINNPEPIYAVIGIGSVEYREKMVKRLDVASHSLNFPTIISRRATLVSSKTSQIGEGTVVAQGAVIAIDTNIGRFSLINHNVVIGHDSKIGDCVTVNPNSAISGFCVVEDGANIGAGVNIIPKKTIGHHAILGAGAVVISDIPASCTAVGIPAKPIATYFDNKISRFTPPPK